MTLAIPPRVYKTLRPEDRVTLSDDLRLRVRKVAQDSRALLKPLGLWYAFGRDWADFVRRTKFGHEGHYAYRLDLDLDRILIASTVADVFRISERYGEEDRLFGASGHVYVRWDLVAQDYDGIEIVPYQPSLKQNPRVQWYSTWDVASGCVWDPRAVLGLARISLSPASLAGARDLDPADVVDEFDERLQRFLRRDEIFRLQGIHGDWLSGGCWKLADALMRWFNSSGASYAAIVALSGRDVMSGKDQIHHVVVQVGDRYIDGDGVWTKRQLLAEYKFLDRARLEPFVRGQIRGIPGPCPLSRRLVPALQEEFGPPGPWAAAILNAGKASVEGLGRYGWGGGRG